MTQARTIRLLIVDDSAFARKVLRELFSKTQDIEIVGIARDGLDALEQCLTLRPDVITLDLMMPELDGLGVLKSLSKNRSAPRVVLVSSSAIDSNIAVEALQLGAVGLVQKPTALATDRLYEVGEELIRQVRIAGSSVAWSRSLNEPPIAPTRASRSEASVIVVGTSTGGPHALTQLFGSLPADLRVPLAAVVHIPVGYTQALAERLDRGSALHVVEAEEGLEVRPGMGVIARAGFHLRLERAGLVAARCRLSLDPLSAPHRPSVDALFTSAADAFGRGVIAAVLTGMGQDGREGARAIRREGGTTLTEHASSSVVDGMPRAVLEAGLSDGEATLQQMPGALLALL